MKSRLVLTYTLPLEIPDEMGQLGKAALVKHLDQVLGDVVHQGLKVVVAKRLAGIGVKVGGLHHHLEVELPKREAGTLIDKRLLIAAAPHLTDEELAELEARVGNVAFLPSEELHKRLRAQALKIANEVRLTPVHVVAEKSNGEAFEADAHLNITHGALFFGEEHRSVRFKANAPVKVLVPGVDEPLVGRYQGSTLGGPVVEVPLAALVPHRDRLLAGWLAQRSR